MDFTPLSSDDPRRNCHRDTMSNEKMSKIATSVIIGLPLLALILLWAKYVFGN